MEKYNSNTQQVLLKILELSESSAPVTLSLGYVSADNCCRAGIVIKEAPSSVIQAIVSDERIFTTHLEYDGLHLSTKAQRIGMKNKRETVRRSANGEVSIFAGIVKCADCGGNMIFNRKENKSCTHEFYRCGTYQQKGKNVCQPHRIDYDVLYNAVLADIKQYAKLAIEDEKKLIDRILKDNDAFKNKSVARYEKNIHESKNRVQEIDKLLQSLFEEKLSGNVTDAMFKRMATKYEDEQTKLIDEVNQLELELDECKRVQQDLTGWIARIKECLSVDTLTRAIAVELISRIEVSETYDTDGEKTLDLEIFYKFDLNNSKKENRAI